MGAPIYKIGDLSSEILADASDDVSKLNTSNTVEEDKPVEEKKTVISVREGKQKRDEQFKIDKKAIKDKRDNEINALGKNQENLPEGIRRKKEARTTKRREMQDLRDKERGQRRTDRRNRGIERLGNRNNMSTEDATKAYDTRTSTYAAYNVNAANQNSINAMEQQDKKGDSNTLGDKILGAPGSTLSKTKLDTNSAGSVQKNITPSKPTKSPVDMLGPTQQEASEDSLGMSSFMMNSKNRRGH